MSQHLESDDSTLLNDFRDKRSEAAFTELVRRHLPLVFHVALRRLGSAALAEEAAQHAFGRLAAKVAAVARHPERLRAWLHRTAYFEASTLARKETRLSRLPVPIEPNLEPMNRPEIYDRLDEALNKLPELDRELVLRHCCGGEDYRRMAAAVGKSEAACQKRVERSLAKLGQGLGGARTAGVVFAAFAATSMKLPAAEQVAAAALKYHTATSSVAGAVSGMQLAACAVLAMAGGAAGWEPVKTPPTPPAEVRSAMTRSATASIRPVAAGKAPLAPRPASISRSLDEVLESIQARRIAPLIEFLPHATVTDLRAIIAEDDVSGLGERMGSFGPARGLALQRWVEIDPEGAFRYGIARDHESGGGMGTTTLLLAKWMSADAGSALAAYAALSTVDRHRVISRMAEMDDSVAGQLAAADPGMAWIVREYRLLHPVLETPPEIPQPPIAAVNLPPGPMRTAAAGREAEEMMAIDPESAIRRLQSLPTGQERQAVYDAVARSLDCNDPWRLIDLVANLRGTLDEGNLERALFSAGREDPLRALAQVPKLAAKVGKTQSLVHSILRGWREVDVAAAIQWPAVFGNAVAKPHALEALLESEDEAVRLAAQEALQVRVGNGLADGTAAASLAELPPPIADKICSNLAATASAEERHDEALGFVALASPACYRARLPEIAVNALRHDLRSGLALLRTLPEADRRLIVKGGNEHLDRWHYHNAAEIRQTLENLVP